VARCSVHAVTVTLTAKNRLQKARRFLPRLMRFFIVTTQARDLLRTRTREGMMVSEQGGWVASYVVP